MMPLRCTTAVSRYGSFREIASCTASLDSFEETRPSLLHTFSHPPFRSPSFFLFACLSMFASVRRPRLLRSRPPQVPRP